MTDPIADLLTRIRNAGRARHESVVIPHSKLKLAIVKRLKETGFIKAYETVETNITVHLKYTHDQLPLITGIQRMSTPGRRVYKSYKEIRPVMNGLGVILLSTPGGILTDNEARQKKMGGELLFKVW